MSCYMRHMDWLLDDLGMEINSHTRKDVDKAIRKRFGFSDDEECPAVWQKVKGMSTEERMELADQLEL